MVNPFFFLPIFLGAPPSAVATRICVDLGPGENLLRKKVEKSCNFFPKRVDKPGGWCYNLDKIKEGNTERRPTMKKHEYTNTMPYIYESERKGSKYSMDNGESFKNHGEFLESVAKFHRGLEYLVNPATSYDTGSDIEEMSASVKSSNASLACLYGNSKEQIIEEYFKNVHSTLWIFMVDIDEQIIEYHMNAEEFREFLNEWATTAVESGSHLTKVRIKKTSGKMVKWLEEKIA